MAGSFKSLITKFESLNTDAICKSAMNQTKGALLRENKLQLYAGKLRTGQDLYPTYLDDPYFSSREAAQKYSDFKDRITPNPERKKGVPNLFIIGTFYASIDIEIGADFVEYESDFQGFPSIKQEFSGNIFGLGGKYKTAYLNNSLRPALLSGIRKIIKL
jgi:hypothetical protein